jgi:Pyridoxamine 5'-phosphate oxidase
MTGADREKLLTSMRQEPYAVQASVTPPGAPQAAIVGVVVTDRFEVFSDTLADSRKAVNLRHNLAVAFVIGPAAAGSERTVQLEGVADEPRARSSSDSSSCTLPDSPMGVNVKRGWESRIGA